MTKFIFLSVTIVLFSNFIFGQTYPDNIPKIIKYCTNNNKFSGVIAVQKGNKIIFNEAFGYYDIDLKKNNTLNTKFLIGSNTKTYTAFLIYQLEKLNLLNRKDFVFKYLTDFKFKKMTIAHLLNMSSGMNDFINNHEERIKNTFKYKKQDVYNLILSDNDTLTFSSGTKTEYCNSNYYLLGLIIEKVTNLNYEQALLKYIIKPLNLKNTGTNYSYNLKNSSKGYSTNDSNKLELVKLTNPDFTYSAGNMYSNIYDIMKFNTHLNEILITESGEIFFGTSVVKDTFGIYGGGLGFGKENNKKIYTHAGHIIGYKSLIARIPEDSISITILSNTESNCENIYSTILNSLYDKNYKLPFEKIEFTLTKEIKEKYIGNYEFEGMTMEITIKENNMYAQIKAEGQQALRIIAESESKFYSNEMTGVEITFSENKLILKQNGQKVEFIKK